MKKLENQKIEYKTTWRDDYLKWICGFANSGGGKVYIGVDDKGVAIGVPDVKELLEKIPNQITDALEIVCKVNVIKKNKKDVIEIIVNGYSNPISFRGKFYIRSGATNRELNNEDLLAMLQKKRESKFESEVQENFKFIDLDMKAIKFFKEKAIECGRLPKTIIKDKPKELLTKLNLINENGKITRAGVLLFAKEPNKYILNSQVKIGKFQDNDADLRYQSEIGGPLITIIDKVIDKIYESYLKGLIRYKGIQRVEEYLINEEAFREIVTNAVVHKSYETLNPIQISIYDDRIYIFNTAKFPKKLSSEDALYKKHNSYPYNPLIANVFFRAGFIENWGRGFEKILQGIKVNKGPRPSFEISEDGVMALYVAQDEYMKLLKELRKDTTQENYPRKLPKKTTQEKDIVKNNTKDNIEKKMINLIKQQPRITIKELANDLELTVDGVKYHITKMKKKNILKHVGSTKAGYWVIK